MWTLPTQEIFLVRTTVLPSPRLHNFLTVVFCPKLHRLHRPSHRLDRTRPPCMPPIHRRFTTECAADRIDASLSPRFHRSLPALLLRFYWHFCTSLHTQNAANFSETPINTDRNVISRVAGGQKRVAGAKKPPIFDPEMRQLRFGRTGQNGENGRRGDTGDEGCYDRLHLVRLCIQER